jgi:hypothetical protein
MLLIYSMVICKSDDEKPSIMSFDTHGNLELIQYIGSMEQADIDFGTLRMTEGIGTAAAAL